VAIDPERLGRVFTERRDQERDITGEGCLAKGTGSTTDHDIFGCPTRLFGELHLRQKTCTLTSSFRGAASGR
jgi:hypothetical protein